MITYIADVFSTLHVQKMYIQLIDMNVYETHSIGI